MADEEKEGGVWGDALGYLLVAGALGVGILVLSRLGGRESPKPVSETPRRPSATAVAKNPYMGFGENVLADARRAVAGEKIETPDERLSRLTGEPPPRTARADAGAGAAGRTGVSGRPEGGLSAPERARFASGTYDTVRYGGGAPPSSDRAPAETRTAPEASKPDAGGGGRSSSGGVSAAYAGGGAPRAGGGAPRAGGGSRDAAGAPGKSGADKKPAALGDPRGLDDAGLPDLDASAAADAKSKAGVPEVRGRSVADVEADPVYRAVIGQMDVDNKVEEHVRAKIREYERAGLPVSRDKLREDAENFAARNGIEDGAVDLPETVERAMAPKPETTPQEMGEFAKNTFKNYTPPTEEKKREILKELANPPPKPAGPPPKSAIQAYCGHREAFERAKREYGVEPHHILGILGVETRFGNYTGKHNVMDIFYTAAEKGGKQGKWAQKNVTALLRLDSRGDLGREKARTIRGSYAGAFGVPQFLPASWEAYSKDASGGGRDPFDFDDAVLSVANYLKIHGYDQDPKKSFFGYNHSQDYVRKVDGLAERIKPGLGGPC